jgi:uncharacterized NAD-dependent epimerase/dehydratase family protein
MLKAHQKIVIHFQDQLDDTHGKMGHGILRFSENPVACVIDTRYAGQSVRDVLDFGPDCPVVGSIAEAAALGAEVLVLGTAPSGGRLKDGMFEDILRAVEAGMSIVNGLHQPLSDRFPGLVKGQWVWDIRREPADLEIAQGRARGLKNCRLLTIGTDMAVGKMTTGLGLYREARAQGIDADFLATGQIGIAVRGQGVPLDAVRVDYACGAIEQMVMASSHRDLLVVEGQGSLLHPGSTSTLPLLRGACPTHLLLCHRAGATHLQMGKAFPIPPLDQVVRLYESLSDTLGLYVRARTIGVALNTASLTAKEGERVCQTVERETGLPTTDVMRWGAGRFIEQLFP